MCASKHAAFQWQDLSLLEQQLSDEERMVRQAAEANGPDQLQPRLLHAFRNEQTDASMFREMGDLGLPGLPMARIPAPWPGSRTRSIAATSSRAPRCGSPAARLPTCSWSRPRKSAPARR